MMLLALLRRVRRRVGAARRAIGAAMQTLSTRFRYWQTIRRIRAKPKGEKIKVLFLNSETSKWKCQSVYRKMLDSGVFDPVIGITALGEQSTYSDSELETVFSNSERFFDTLGDKHIRTVELNPKRYRDLAEFSPDIVFFPEPWATIYPQTTQRVACFALTCYVPYFVFMQSNPKKHCALEMHRSLSRYFVMNKSIVREYSKTHSWWRQSFDFVVSGHPAISTYNASENGNRNAYVIYAPHFSVWFPSRCLSTPISTFLDTGEVVLAYAEQHPEIKWAFKPHPKLRKYIVETNYWTREKIDAYYKAWEEIGTVCYDGNYGGLFGASCAMITDCDSFLVEYGATGKPIIHLRRTDRIPQYHPYVQDLLKSYYAVYNVGEMRSMFELVLECNEDPKKEMRLRAVEKAGLLGVDAAQNIVDYLRKLLGR